MKSRLLIQQSPKTGRTNEFETPQSRPPSRFSCRSLTPARTTPPPSNPAPGAPTPAQFPSAAQAQTDAPASQDAATSAPLSPSPRRPILDRHRAAGRDRSPEALLPPTPPDHAPSPVPPSTAPAAKPPVPTQSRSPAPRSKIVAARVHQQAPYRKTKKPPSLHPAPQSTRPPVRDSPADLQSQNPNLNPTQSPRQPSSAHHPKTVHSSHTNHHTFTTIHHHPTTRFH